LQQDFDTLYLSRTYPSTNGHSQTILATVSDQHNNDTHNSRERDKHRREVFWTTTTFEFSWFENLMRFFHMKRNVAVGRRQVPPNPGQLIRHITSASRGTACIEYELTCYTCGMFLNDRQTHERRAQDEHFEMRQICCSSSSQRQPF
jgi:hypothetical protein